MSQLLLPRACGGGGTQSVTEGGLINNSMNDPAQPRLPEGLETTHSPNRSIETGGVGSSVRAA